MQITKKKLNAKGFTLIELLIVIIIIGILAAVAFVAYNGSQQKAKKADAQSTLSSVKAKLGEYSADNGNYPVDKAAVNTYLTSTTGGNSQELATKFNGAGYSYSAKSDSGATCDNSTTQCTTFTLTATAATLGFSGGDITMSN